MPKELLKTIMDSAPIAIVHLDLEERYVFANKHYIEHFDRKNVLGLKVLEVIGPEAYEKAKPYFDEAYAGRKAQGEMQINRQAKTPIYVDTIYAPSFNEAGILTGIIVLSEDITEKKTTEARLNLSNERLAFALRSTGMGTWDIDLRTEAISCSPEMLELWELAPEEFDSSRNVLQSRVVLEDLAGMKSAINRAIEDRSVYEHEYRIRTHSGAEKWILAKGQRSEDGSHFSGIVYDITEKKLKEKALHLSVENQIRFLKIASHELRTPLTSLQLHANLRARLVQKDGPLDEHRNRIEAALIAELRQLRRITSLVDNILEVSLFAADKLEITVEPLDLCEVMRDLIDRFKEIHTDGKVEVHFTGCEKRQGNWDKLRLEQALMCILINAFKYGNGNTIDVSVNLFEDCSTIVVQDRGMGIALLDQKRIFQRFERAISENEVSGFGIGLHIAETIIKAHGGEIRLKSTVGVGSEFTVVLPYSAP